MVIGSVAKLCGNECENVIHVPECMKQARSQGGFGGFDRTTLFSANRIGKFIHTPPTLISRDRRQDGRQTEGRDLYIMMLNQKKVPFQYCRSLRSRLILQQPRTVLQVSQSVRTTTRALPDYYPEKLFSRALQGYCFRLLQSRTPLPETLATNL